VPDLPAEEARLKAKILPLRLHVDQDALDFLKKFFAFNDSTASPPSSSPKNEVYLQHAEVFPVDIKLDYKPKRVDYKALRDGKTIELMNFFHFDGAEMTLRHITLSGITGWPTFFDTLNDLWTPDVKANQLADVISGVSPIRSVVNVGTGVADLVLIPIAQYKKDRRVVRGVQKGTSAFMKSAGMEAIKLGARLATGTQVILEQAENVLGGDFKNTVTAEAVVPDNLGHSSASESSDDESDSGHRHFSRYADQPSDVTEGVQAAYRSLRTNFNTAAQTILAVPMEVYERSGNEGAARAVIRAVPIAVLKPMIGATEAVSKTLLGLRNTLDPGMRQEIEEKYKKR
jgi:autophagy-related protein 2